MEQVTGNGKHQYNHTKKKQAKFKVGDVCYATHEKFVGLMRVEILKCNENSAMVKIIVCAKECDEKEQAKLNDITIIPYKRMKKIISKREREDAKVFAEMFGGREIVE